MLLGVLKEIQPSGRPVLCTKGGGTSEQSKGEIPEQVGRGPLE